MGKWIKDNIFNIIGILPIVGAVVVGVLAWLQHISWYLIAFYGITIAVIVLFGIERIDVWKERHKKKLTQLSDKEIEDIICNWLTKPGYKFEGKDINNPLFHNDRLFHFEVEDEWGRVISIARPKAVPTRLDLSSAVALTPEHKRKYEALRQSDKNDTLRELRIEMARFGVIFRGIETTLDRVDIGISVSLDDTLSEFYFKERILFMIRATFLLNELIVQQLGLD